MGSKTAGCAFLVCLAVAFSVANGAVVYQDTFPAGSYKVGFPGPGQPPPYLYLCPAPPPMVNNNATGLTETSNPFIMTMPQLPAPEGLHDRCKFMTFASRPFFPGATGKVKYTLEAGVKVYNVEKHPFGKKLVTKPFKDLRLGHCALLGQDMNSTLLINFLITKNGIYAHYERPASATSGTQTWHAFGQVKYVGSRKEIDMHTLSIETDVVKNEISYYVGKKRVLHVTKPGMMLPEKDGVRTMSDNGGKDRIEKLSALFTGWGCFTILDAVDYWNKKSTEGLVRLVPDKGFYNLPKSFYDEKSMNSTRLWGQGASISIKKFTVEAY